MLKYDVKRVMWARGKTQFFTYLRKQGYNPNTASRLLNAHIKNMNLKHVEQLCLLLDCTPNDLLEWEPDHSIASPEKKALSSLIRKDELSKASHLLYQVPLDELVEVARYLRAKVEKGRGE